MTDEVTAPALEFLPRNKATILRNITCAYCGNGGEPNNPLTNEHVIGRRFVPKGSFASGWSLQVQACKHCNDEKADLEDDISAITILPDLGTAHDDSKLAKLAVYKAQNSFSRRTKKLVADSREENEITVNLMESATVRFGFTGPPQIDEERVLRLAYFHLQAFYYLITYSADRQTGGFMLGEKWCLDCARRPDWGNPLQRGFAQLTRGWPPRVEGAGAKFFFKIAIRRVPSGAELWSFALEWNKNLRIIGFFGDPERAQVHVDALPLPASHRIDDTWSLRPEVPLDPAEDILFVPVQAAI